MGGKRKAQEMELLILAGFSVLLAVAALIFGADSRNLSDRNWW